MTGGSGLLGSQILKIDSDIIAPPHSELDVADLDSVVGAIEKHRPDILLHLAAATKPPEHERNPEPGLRVNIIGTANLALACHRFGVKLVYTSTDYLYIGSGPHRETEPIFPPYKFAWSKLGGECAASMLADYLILRIDFGPIPFPWEKVYKEQYNSKLYVDEMAPLVLAAAKSGARGIMNLGGPRTSLEAYARRTRPDIETILKPEWVPPDTSFDLTRMKQELKIDENNLLLRQ